MPSRAQEFLREALGWSVDERAEVAAELIASLDEPLTDLADLETAWAAEIERRARRVLAGESTGIPCDEVRRRADAELRNR